jgi:hypothetical protein
MARTRRSVEAKQCVQAVVRRVEAVRVVCLREVEVSELL